VQQDAKLAQIYARIPTDTHVLLTHCGPHGCLDLSAGPHGHLGSRALLARVQQLPVLRLHVFGHVHAATDPDRGFDHSRYESIHKINARLKKVGAQGDTRIVKLLKPRSAEGAAAAKEEIDTDSTLFSNVAALKDAGSESRNFRKQTQLLQYKLRLPMQFDVNPDRARVIRVDEELTADEASQRSL
jgi:hypothetical protein